MTMTKYLQWTDYRMWLLAIVSRICLDNTFVEEPWLGNEGERVVLSWVLLLLSIPLMQSLWKTLELYSSKILIYTELFFYTVGFIPFTSLVYRGWFADELIWRMAFYWLVLWIAGYLSAMMEPKWIKKIVQHYCGNYYCLIGIVIICMLVVLYINVYYTGGRFLLRLTWNDIYIYIG